MARTKGKDSGSKPLKQKSDNPAGKGVRRSGRGGDTGVYARIKKRASPGDGRINNGGTQKGSNNGGGTKKGFKHLATKENIAILREKIDKLGIRLGHEADPIIGLLEFFWDGTNPWNERREAVEMVLVRLYHKLGTVEGSLPDMNLLQQNQTNIDMSNLSLDEKRKLLSVANKAKSNGDDVIDV